MVHKKIFINADGGSRGNPGPAALGVVLRDEDQHEIETCGEYLGKTTNNVAEYKSLLKGLQLAAKYHAEEVFVYMDSELVVRQMSGHYKVKAKHLAPLFAEVKKVEKQFSKVVYRSVPRSNPFQKQADALVNQALDEKSHLHGVLSDVDWKAREKEMRDLRKDFEERL
ncbi:TPA: ribonuclease HI family protein [Candidatus Woesearchaeota archaeon]|nr:MAG: putative phosphoglycerate mutase [archaeon GW2011_AR16]HIG95886.1 ribonuclease HI family protein [Candidatus Woesearchaeota archaeon]HIH47451.1 ribonuclease HI family protein [Candidatus Woesearchaeota archaeon]HII88848.1 ribonuclease HI family protein [Candidatus Woesearchaeota archaeon]